jgi:RNA polymerase-binding transcription factor DksA
MIKNSDLYLTKKVHRQYKPTNSQSWNETAKSLRDEERDLIETLIALKSFSTNKIIDHWLERNSLNYEKALRHRLAQIREALIRLGQHNYGVCSECGDKIDLKRLKADPAISRCLNCQNERES